MIAYVVLPTSESNNGIRCDQVRDIFVRFVEGFGLPAVEAMACGTPVICANTASLPEVVGDAAIAVDPFGIEAIAGAIKRVIEDQSLRNELTLKGQQRASAFDWRETARRTLAVYEEVARESVVQRTIR